ncbi:porin [Variovorax sp. dw_954]|uniref:porin n=1 Tax=Variovorax sp. dw_954 TaxID=2720078 RepID=UPI001BD1DA31|nr:porin [Variovorax sp. dw_954]
MKRAVFGVLVSGLGGASLTVSAQTSQTTVDRTGVTLFGVADIAIGYGEGSTSRLIQLYSGGNATSRFGIRGVQDLGGGLAAGFWLEAGYTLDNGLGMAGNTNNQPGGATPSDVISFNRRATVSLIDWWGELRLGRDKTASYRNREDMDPFGNNGVGTTEPQVESIAGPTSTRASNMVGYFLPPDFYGFFGEVQYFLGENVTGTGLPPTHDGTGYAARLGYSAGNFALAVAGSRARYASTADFGTVRVFNIGAAYDFEFVRMTVGYYRDEVDSVLPVVRKGFVLGAIVPVGLNQLKMAYSSYGTRESGDPAARKLSLGYVYNLSKRTALYATGAYVHNSGGSTTALNGASTAPNRSSRGMDLGMRHSF